jgi:HK97 family phage major capsid protein
MKSIAWVIVAILAMVGVSFALGADAASGGLVSVVMAADLQKLEAAMKVAFERMGKTMGDRMGDFEAQLLDLQQQRTAGHAPIFGGLSTAHELVDAIHKNDGFKAFLAGQTPTCAIQVPARLVYQNNTITNPNPLSNDNPLVPADRGRLVAAPLRRLTVRALFSQVPTASNLIEVPSEASYTNNAAPQGGPTSPIGHGEAELKQESSMTFSLSSFPVVTIAHFIKASRQILSDAPMLKSHVDRRLLHGLALEEEDEMLTGNGSAGTMRGLNSFAQAFLGGVTNATALDTLARAIDQLQGGSNYEASGIILHPTDWLNITLLKNSQGDYILGNPSQVTAPQLWGKPVVPTAAQTQGTFTVLDAPQAGFIADRETATIRVSENVNDDFTRNVITILCENRTVLVVEQGNAIVKGNVSHAG